MPGNMTLITLQFVGINLVRKLTVSRSRYVGARWLADCRAV